MHIRCMCCKFIPGQYLSEIRNVSGGSLSLSHLLIKTWNITETNSLRRIVVKENKLRALFQSGRVWAALYLSLALVILTFQRQKAFSGFLQNNGISSQKYYSNKLRIKFLSVDKRTQQKRRGSVTNTQWNLLSEKINMNVKKIIRVKNSKVISLIMVSLQTF